MSIGLLKGSVKHYDWGGKKFIPQLLNITGPVEKPFAEYWLGVHPQANCEVQFAGKDPVLLSSYIQQNQVETLGSYVADTFGNIPYLFKALDVNDMLSIQVHPNKQAAKIDFAAEAARGIPLTDPTRNYKDDNHKPELMVAMGEFWLLHGFRPPSSMKEILIDVPELNFLREVFGNGNYAGLYKLIMEMPQEEVNEQLQPLLERIVPLFQQNKIEKTLPDYWAAKAHLTFSQPGKIDRGIFSIYIFNLVHLKDGEAVFQDAGVPHAYMEGHNIEIMASSDNVLRGGLTIKHIDVKELLKHTKCEATEPNILKGTEEKGERIYKTIAPDFELSSYTLDRGESVDITPKSAEILLLVSGHVSLTDEVAVDLHPGAPAAALFPGGTVQLTASAASLIFKAAVPQF
jgi:mannose-6-phosphate isomerase